MTAERLTELQADVNKLAKVKAELPDNTQKFWTQAIIELNSVLDMLRSRNAKQVRVLAILLLLLVVGCATKQAVTPTRRTLAVETFAATTTTVATTPICFIGPDGTFVTSWQEFIDNNSSGWYMCSVVNCVTNRTWYDKSRLDSSVGTNNGVTRVQCP
jgi:hypothetical protein